VKGEDSICTTIDQSSDFTHFLVIYLEYGVALVTYLSSGEMFGVHE
jgi:hypothetical protein